MRAVIAISPARVAAFKLTIPRIRISHFTSQILPSYTLSYHTTAPYPLPTQGPLPARAIRRTRGTAHALSSFPLHLLRPHLQSLATLPTTPGPRLPRRALPLPRNPASPTSRHPYTRSCTIASITWEKASCLRHRRHEQQQFPGPFAARSGRAGNQAPTPATGYGWLLPRSNAASPTTASSTAAASAASAVAASAVTATATAAPAAGNECPCRRPGRRHATTKRRRRILAQKAQGQRAQGVLSL